MDIRSGCGYPGASLSNFAPHKFIIDDVECNSMEGFLQSLKFKNPDMQLVICQLVGKSAKFAGKKKKWWRDQKLYWRGKELERSSKEYQDLLDRAFDALCKQSEKFRLALLATGNATIEHSMGKTDKAQTVLTRQEFCSRLTKLRAELQKENHEV